MHLVVVSGKPGAGKTTLATPLADKIGFPMLTKDMVKEALADGLPDHPIDHEWSQTLGRLAYDVMWAVAGAYDRLVIEANFYESHRDRIRTLDGPIVEIYCRCPSPIAASRYAQRAGNRHPIHVQATIDDAMLSQFESPLDVGPVLTVDTSGPVDVDAVARWVLQQIS